MADFFFIHNCAGRVIEIAFARRGIDGRCAEKEADLFWRFVAFALAVKIDPGNSAAGFAEWNRDKISGLARAAELGLVIRRFKSSAVDFEFLADVSGEF